MFEKIISQRMMNYISKSNILTASKFGFTTNTSIELATTSIYDKLLQNIHMYNISLFGNCFTIIGLFVRLAVFDTS